MRIVCSLSKHLGLLANCVNSIISARERRRDYRRRPWARSVCNHALELNSDVREFRNADGNCPPRSYGALSNLLAADLRVSLPTWLLGARCSRLSSGFLPHDNRG